jgi:DNA-binding CsgD family transcriptional regulator
MNTPNNKHRLDFTAAETIRARHRDGASPRQLADEFGVNLSTVYDALGNRTHRARVTVPLDPRDLEVLEQVANHQGRRPEEVAARMLQRSLETALVVA